METVPQIRTVGSASTEEKENAKQELIQKLFSHFESLKPDEREQLEKLEYPKSPTELALINFNNKETDELMEQAGIEPYDIPIENFHIVPPELYKKTAGDDSVASTFTRKQGILFNAQEFRNNPVSFGKTVLHEMMHLKAHLSLEVTEKDDVKKEDEKENAVITNLYRRGVKAGSSQKHDDTGKAHEHFKGLDEAIIETQVKRSLLKLIDTPELSKEKEWLLSEKAQQLKNDLVDRKRIPKDDIVWIGEKGEDDWVGASYPKHREVLDYVCSEIQKQFPEQYHYKNDVFKEFLKAHFTGQLLPIARLVEKTFGEGNFRILGNMEVEGGSAILHLETLKKARGRQIRSNTI